MLADKDIDGVVRAVAPRIDTWFIAPLPGPRLVTLPSPFALSHGTDVTPRAMAEGVLKPQLDAIDADLVVLEEPYLAREENADLGAVEEALGVLAGGPKLALWLTFGNARHVLSRGVADLPVDAIGIDFYATRADDVPEGFDKLLLAGVLDARSSVLEEPREIAAFVETLHGRGIADVALVPNGDLQYVSEPVAREKLGRLGKAKTATTEAAA
jgi:hypothetical protein